MNKKITVIFSLALLASSCSSSINHHDITANRFCAKYASQLSAIPPKTYHHHQDLVNSCLSGYESGYKFSKEDIVIVNGKENIFESKKRAAFLAGAKLRTDNQ